MQLLNLSWFQLGFLFVISVSKTCTLCSPTDRRWSQYVTTPPPGNFEGESTGVGCNGAGNCLGPTVRGTGRLGDEMLGSQDLNGVFVGHAWNQNVNIQFSFVDITVSIRGINLYFYNIPSRGIGLPYNIRLATLSDPDHSYLLEGNDILTQEDSGLQTVTLRPETLFISRADPDDVLTIEFEFSNDCAVSLLLLTEVEFCTTAAAIMDIRPSITFSPNSPSTVSPTNITSSITLTCSVTEGRFDWTWTGPTNPTPTITMQQLVLNAGRTSVLELSGLSSDDEGTYQCEATHPFETMTLPIPSASISFNVELSPQGTLQAERTIIDVNATSKTAVLRCFLYGYLSSREEPSIKWQEVTDTSQDLIINDSVNTITIEMGDMLIQNGGAQPVPSLISTLTVDLTRYLLTATTRLYTCSSNQTARPQVITLTTTSLVEPGTSTSSEETTSTSNEETTSTSSEETGVGSSIIGVSIGVSLLILIVILTIFGIVLVIIVTHLKKTKNFKAENETLGTHEFNMMQNTMYGAQLGKDSHTFNMTSNTIYDAEHSHAFNMTENTTYKSSGEQAEESNLTKSEAGCISTTFDMTQNTLYSAKQANQNETGSSMFDMTQNTVYSTEEAKELSSFNMTQNTTYGRAKHC